MDEETSDDDIEGDVEAAMEVDEDLDIDRMDSEIDEAIQEGDAEEHDEDIIANNDTEDGQAFEEGQEALHVHNELVSLYSLQSLHVHLSNCYNTAS